MPTYWQEVESLSLRARVPFRGSWQSTAMTKVLVLVLLGAQAMVLALVLAVVLPLVIDW